MPLLKSSNQCPSDADFPAEPLGSETVGELTVSDGYAVRYRHWRAMGDRPRGYLLALHGIQSHSGWYLRSCEMLANAGWDVTFMDRRGSGMNCRDRGDVAHADRLINDVVQFLGDVRQRRDEDAPGAPVILSAVSWGGRLAAIVAARRPELVDALVLQTPGLFSKVGPTALQRGLLRFAGKIGQADKRVRIPLDDPRLFTDQPDWQEFLRTDRFALHEVTVRFLQASLQLESLAQQLCTQVACPTLLMLAAGDPIIDNCQTERFFEQLSCPGKACQVYNESTHTLEFSRDPRPFLEDLLSFCENVADRR